MLWHLANENNSGNSKWPKTRKVLIDLTLDGEEKMVYVLGINLYLCVFYLPENWALSGIDWPGLKVWSRVKFKMRRGVCVCCRGEEIQVSPVSLRSQVQSKPQSAPDHPLCEAGPNGRRADRQRRHRRLHRAQELPILLQVGFTHSTHTQEVTTLRFYTG